MIESIINSNKANFVKVLDHFQHEMSSLRTGRANPALLSTVMVESYGTKMPIQQVSSISATDAKTLTISPWDKSQLQEIEKAITAANLGFTPSNDGNVIRINLPPLTEERRKEMVKLLGQLAENARIGVRQAREEILKTMKKSEADGEVGKDDLTFGQKKLQDVVDDFNKQIKVLTEDKEREIMTV